MTDSPSEIWLVVDRHGQVFGIFASRTLADVWAKTHLVAGYYHITRLERV